MMWKIVYFTTSSGRAPAKKFLDKLPQKSRAKIRNLYRLIQEFGPNLGQPHMKSLTGCKPLLEFRVLGLNSLRLIAVLDKQYVIVLHGFTKKTQKTPLKELKKAQNRYKRLDI